MTAFLKLSQAIFSIEARNIIAYRFNFWLTFCGTVFTHYVTGYFIWKSIFEFNNTGEMNGYNLAQLSFYYFITPMVSRTILGKQYGLLTVDIYNGSLNKFLLYPLSVFHFKYITQLADCFFKYILMTFGLLAISLVVGIDDTISISLSSYLYALPFIFIGTTFYFLLTCSLEQISFWVDNVWSLNVALRFFIHFFGGFLIPLEFYPEFARKLIYYLPFQHMITTPVNIITHKISLAESLNSLGILAFWIFIFVLINRAVWRRGIYQYSGVGI